MAAHSLRFVHICRTWCHKLYLLGGLHLPRMGSGTKTKALHMLQLINQN